MRPNLWFRDVTANARPLHGAEAGFTLIEALAALAVVAASVAVLGETFRANFGAARSLETRLQLLGEGELRLLQLPDRLVAKTGEQRGGNAALNWRVDTQQLGRPASPWTAYAVTVQLQEASGRRLRLDTVRLIRTPAR